MKKASDLVEVFFETYGIRDEKNYAGFMAAWTDIIGPDIASHSRPHDIRAQVLLVAVDHPGWMTRIRFSEQTIIKNIQKRFPQLGIINIAFQLVDKLPPPLRSKTVIEQAIKEPFCEEAVPEPTEIQQFEVTIHEEEISSSTDKTKLFSALSRLRSAMEKRSGSAP